VVQNRGPCDQQLGIVGRLGQRAPDGRQRLSEATRGIIAIHFGK
jgi:hypothetical protein